MAFNFGQAGGGISAPSALNDNSIHNNPVNFGSGRIKQGNIRTGHIKNRQRSHAKGGYLD